MFGIHLGEQFLVLLKLCRFYPARKAGQVREAAPTPEQGRCGSAPCLWLLLQHRKIWCEEKLIFVLVVTLQGMTIRPLVDLLAVKRKRESAPTVGEQIHIRVSGASISTWPGLSGIFWNVPVSRDPADLQFYLNPLQVSPFPCWKSYSGS